MGDYEEERDNESYRAGYDSGRDGSPLDGFSEGFSRDFGGRDGKIRNDGFRAGSRDRERFGPRRTDDSSNNSSSETLEESVDSSDSSSVGSWSGSGSSSSYSSSQSSYRAGSSGFLPALGWALAGILGICGWGILTSLPKRRSYSPVVYKDSNGETLGKYYTYKDAAWGIWWEYNRSECHNDSDLGRATKLIEFFDRYSTAKLMGEEDILDSEMDPLSYSSWLHNFLKANGLNPQGDFIVLDRAIKESREKNLPNFTNELQKLRKQYIYEVSQGISR